MYFCVFLFYIGFYTLWCKVPLRSEVREESMGFRILLFVGFVSLLHHECLNRAQSLVFLILTPTVMNVHTE